MFFPEQIFSGAITTLHENLIRINQTLIENFQADPDFLFSTGP
jgi:hypothetical protein